MRRTSRMTGVVAAGSALALLGSGVAFADQITLSTGDVTSAPGDTISFTVALQATDGDPSEDFDGCNAGAGNDKAQVVFSSSNALVAAAPTGQNITGCDDPATSEIENGVSVSVQVLADADDGATTTMTAAPKDASTGRKVVVGSGNDKVDTYGSFTSASFIITVDRPATTPANTPPQVAVTGVTNGVTYEFGSVPASGCSVTDAEDANESATPVVGAVSGSLSAYGLGEQTATCSYTDGGGLNDSDSVTYSIADTGAPVVTDVGPTATANGSNGWYTSAVGNQFQAADSGAGFVSPLANPHTFTVSSGTTEGSAVKVSSGTVSDVAGNVSNAIDSAAFKIDLSNPTASLTCPASAVLLGSAASASWSGNDTISGLVGSASRSVALDTSSVGTKTATGPAPQDQAGRTGTAPTCSYSVVYSWAGFFQPIDNDPDQSGDATKATVWNSAKAGSAIPVKFSLGGDRGLGILASQPTMTKVTCSALSNAADAIETYSGTTSGLKYDALSQQYNYTYKSASSMAGACYKLTVTLDDSTSHYAFFKFTK